MLEGTGGAPLKNRDSRPRLSLQSSGLRSLRSETPGLGIQENCLFLALA